jgi:pimeloyl-[acyl-carrier protein] methyl ester esterase
MAARARAIFDVDVRASFSKIRLPVLVVTAKADRIVPPLPAPGIKNLREAELDGPHMILQAKPAEAANLVTDFVKNLAR